MHEDPTENRLGELGSLYKYYYYYYYYYYVYMIDIPYISLTRIEAPLGCSLVVEARSLPKRVLPKVTR